jgi:hypothetical protein
VASFQQQITDAQNQYDAAMKMHKLKNDLESNIAMEDFRRITQHSKVLEQTRSDAAAGQTRLSGQLMLSNPGEKSISVTFPFSFADKPLLSFGGEMRDGDIPVDGNFPTVSVVVGGWSTVDNPPYSRLYTGCKLLIVTTGPPQQRLYVHWHLDGIGYSSNIPDDRISIYNSNGDYI